MSARRFPLARRRFVGATALAVLAGTMVAGLPRAAAAEPTKRWLNVEVWNATDTARVFLLSVSEDVTTEAMRRFAVATVGYSDRGSGYTRTYVDDLAVGFTDGRQVRFPFDTAPAILESTTGGVDDALQYDAAGQRLAAIGNSEYGCPINYETVDVGPGEITSLRFTVNRPSAPTGDGSFWDLYVGMTPSESEPIRNESCLYGSPSGIPDNLVGVHMGGDGWGDRRSVRGWADGAVSFATASMTLGTTYIVKMTYAPAPVGSYRAYDLEHENYQTTYYGSGVARNCGLAQAGFCSLEVDPSCCAQPAGARFQIDLPMPEEVREIKFYFLGERTDGDVDSDVLVNLDVGSVRLHMTSGVNNGVDLHSAGFPSAAGFGQWPTANQWHKATIRLDPRRDTVTATIGGATGSTRIDPAAGQITTIDISGTRGSTAGTPVSYDDLRVDPAVPLVTETFETANTQTAYYGTGMTRDCGFAPQGGLCSLKVDPVCCSQGVTSETTADVPLPAEVSYYITSEVTGGDVDSDIVIRLDSGEIRFHNTAGSNNSIQMSTPVWGPGLIGPWGSNAWYKVTAQIDPVANTVKVRIGWGSYVTGTIPDAATRITGIGFTGIRWSPTGYPIRYDTMRIDEFGPPPPPANQPPSISLVSPAAGEHLRYLTDDRTHYFKVQATDPESDTWSAKVSLRRARTGQLVEELTTPVVTSGNGPIVHTGKLEPGEYTWSAVATDSKGAESQPTAPRSFTVDRLDFGAGVYVGLGDSYASGEGAPVENWQTLGIDQYEPGTDAGEDVNECHRSSVAYTRLVAADAGMPARTSFGACSGAETVHLYTSGRYDEPLQFNRLSDETTLVTMSIGGNDAGFASVLEGCIMFKVLSCVDDYEPLVSRRFSRLDADRGTPVSDADRTFDPGIVAVQPLSEVYHRLREAAPNARVLIVGYPKFFKPDGYFPMCSGITYREQLWMNEKVAQINDIIEGRAKERGFEYVDVEDALTNHHLCSFPEIDWMNGISPTDAVWTKESFHPTQRGHAAEADIVRAVRDNPAATPIAVTQGGTVTVNRTVPSGQAKLTAAVRWPGGDVALTLRSPSGRTLTRQLTAADVERQTGSTYEVVTVRDPEPGVWFVDMAGVDVTAGDTAELSVTWQRPANRRPVARFTYAYDGVSTVTVDGSGSSDADGSITEYMWNWGDGTVTTGTPTPAPHKFAPGRYDVTLLVRDDKGGTGVIGTGEILVHGYTFTGFTSLLAPVALNRVNAGQKVQLKWRLTKNDGTPVSDPGSFLRVSSTQVNCDGSPRSGIPVYLVATDNTLKYLGDGNWQYTWTTSSSWKGTCRRMELELADKASPIGAGRYVLFELR